MHANLDLFACCHGKKLRQVTCRGLTRYVKYTHQEYASFPQLISTWVAWTAGEREENVPIMKSWPAFLLLVNNLVVVIPSKSCMSDLIRSLGDLFLFPVAAFEAVYLHVAEIFSELSWFSSTSFLPLIAMSCQDKLCETAERSFQLRRLESLPIASLVQEDPVCYQRFALQRENVMQGSSPPTKNPNALRYATPWGMVSK